MSGAALAHVPYRPLRLGNLAAPTVTALDQGGMRVRPAEALLPFPTRLTDRIAHWAQVQGEVTCAAQRADDGAWRSLSYAALAQRAVRLASGLLHRRLSADRPIMILSGNDLEQLELMTAAMWIGVPVAPVSPAYSLVSSDFAKLSYLLALMTPGMVFVSDAQAFRAALAIVPSDIEIVVARGDTEGRYTPYASLLGEPAGTLLEPPRPVTADTIAKFLFTSGSTQQPKAVPNTQRMLCSNQQMLAQTFAFVTDTPPILVDWLPWHHTFGGNHNLNLVLYNGGTLYIDEGKPTPQLIGQTLQNLREISPTVYFNVPKGWEDIAVAMQHDERLRDRFFARVEMLFYAAAGLAQPIWNMIDELAVAATGCRIRMLAGLGMTETSPMAMFCAKDNARAGEVGVPVPGCETKLVPVDDKLEVRFRGPHVMPGYWRSPDLNAAVFDDEGYLRTGDALKPLDALHPEQGFVFDGRLAEDFKLSSGTFVSVGPLRARLIAAGAPYIQDVVVAGLNRDRIAVLVFPRPDVCLTLAQAHLGAPCPSLEEALRVSAVRAVFEEAVAKVNRSATGSASAIDRALVTHEFPSLDRGELTDKGSVNQRAVLKHRSHVIDAMYAGRSAGLILAATESTA